MSSVHFGSRRFTSAQPGSFRFPWVHFGAPRGRRAHPCSAGFTRVRLHVIGFILVRVGLIGDALGS